MIVRNLLRACIAVFLTAALVHAQIPKLTSGSAGASLTAPPPPASTSAVLYDQMAGDVVNGYTSQDFEASFDAYDNQGADDFIVDWSGGWRVESVDISGQYSTSGGPAPSFNVSFYANASGLPGALVASRPAQPYTNGASPSIALTTPVDLAPGTYWVSVQARMDFVAGGQWYWSNTAPQMNSPAAWQNPGDGFGTGCASWGVLSTCFGGGGPDQAFRLNGTLLTSVPVSPVVISQVYGAGGEAGSVWRNDFVELLNRSNAPVNLTNWTVQYANTNSSTWQSTVLGGTLQPGQYYLLQLGTGASGGAALPSPDLAGTTAMNTTLGKVALMPNRTRISGQCPAAGTWVDFVGYGAAVACSEGGAPTADLGLTASAQRNNNGCDDSNNNGADFSVTGAASPGPRNSAYPRNYCFPVTPTFTPAPTNTPTPANTQPPSPTRTPTPTALPPTATPTSPPGAVVVSQVYSASGVAGSVWRNDFIELFNRSAAPVNLTGWTVQYANTASATWQKQALSGTLQPGQYYLVKQSSGGAVGAALPAADATNTFLMNETLGKVAVVANATSLSGACPAPSTYVDLVGYGAGVACSETGPTGNLSSAVSAVRNGGGCVDTNNNGSDLTVQGAAAPGPRNSASAANPCGSGVAALSGSAGTSGAVGQSGGQLQGVAIGVEMGQPSSGLELGLFVFLAAGLLSRLRKPQSSVQ